jgi:hypothetical protein
LRKQDWSISTIRTTIDGGHVQRCVNARGCRKTFLEKPSSIWSSEDH